MERRALVAISDRPIRYWNEDGIPDLFIGLALLLLGGLLAAVHAGRPLLMITLLLLFLVGARASRSGMLRLKERLVFPRTGRVVPREQKPSTLAMVLAYLLVLGLAALFAVVGPPYRILTVGFGTLLGGGFVYLGHRLQLHRHVVVGALTLLGTAALGVYGPGDQRGVVAVLLGVGSTLLLSGGAALTAYLRSAPPAAAE